MSSFSRPGRGVYVQNNLFKYGGVDLSDVVVVEKITRSLNSSKNLRSTSIPGVDGVYIYGSDYGVRTITLHIRIIEETYSKALETLIDLSKVLNQRREQKIELRDFDALDLYNIGLLESEIEMERSEDTLEGQVKFTCPLPFNYSKTEKKIQISTNTVIENDGVDLHPKFEIDVTTNIAGDITISTDDGQNLILFGPFTAGAKIEYDDYNLRIGGALSNGYMDVVNSSFIRLKTGETKFTVAGIGSNKCYVIFREAML